MMHRVLLMGLAFAAILLIVWETPVSSQLAQPKKNAKQNRIEGVWSKVLDEGDGGLVSFLPRPELPFLGTGNVPVAAFLWKISADVIEMGPDNDLFPLDRCAYELKRDGAWGEVDIFSMNKDGKINKKDKTQGIYFLKDDWLMICTSRENRPDSFSVSGKPDRGLCILRRGKLK